MVQQRDGGSAAGALEDAHGQLVVIQGEGHAPAEVGVVVGLALAVGEHDGLGARVIQVGVGELRPPALYVGVGLVHGLELFHGHFTEYVKLVGGHQHLLGGGVARHAEPYVLGRSLVLGKAVVIGTDNPRVDCHQSSRSWYRIHSPLGS